MPALHYCNYNGCRKLVPLKDTYCDNHTQHVQKRSHDVVRRPQSAVYHSTQWRRTSRLFRSENPLCKQCLIEHAIDKSKPIELGTSVDHVIPLRILLATGTQGLTAEGKRLYKTAQKNKLTPFDWSNLQSLCAYHHAEKTSEEQQLYLD